MLFGQEGNNLGLILLSQSVEMKCETLVGSEFERILDMKPNLNLDIFSTQKPAIFLVFFMVFVVPSGTALPCWLSFLYGCVVLVGLWVGM